MRSAGFAVLVLIVAGLAAWLWLGGDRDAPPPSDSGRPSTADPDQPGDAELERAPVDTPETPDVPAKNDAAEERPPTSPVPAAPEPNVALKVLSAGTSAAVGTFRYSFRHAGATVRGDGRDGDVQVTFPPATSGELIVEAAGHVPLTQPLITPAPDRPLLVVEVFLDPAAVAAGIEIVVADPAGQPVTNVRVDSYRLAPGSEQGDWRRGPMLWSRRTSDAGGRYVLPEMAPGGYGIRLLATEADGEPLPLLPFARTFQLTGTNGFVERAMLEPGCVLGLELTDLQGRPLEPDGLSIDLRLPGAPPTSRRWVQRNDDGRFAADDAPPNAGLCWLDEPIPAGVYRLRISHGGQVRYDQQIALRQGERQHERISLP